MPKKVNLTANERVDLNDALRAANDYTQESVNFNRQKLLQSKNSLVANGFRIEISDQTASPGEFTIFNGVGIDRSGNILNNEDQINDSRTLTLSGTTTSFYIEVEFVETISDVDSRAFWDSTFAGNTPPGREFSLNVATRISPDWQVVNPISTTGFQVDTSPSSVRIPVAVLYTNASNEITGFTAINASTVLAEDVLAAATEFRVLDSTLFPDTGTATLNFGGSPSESVNITNNDRANGIITIAPGLTNGHQAGAIVRETGVTAAFVPESTEAVPAAPGATSSGDQRRGLFKGDELRGSALVTSPQIFGTRDDTQLQAFKDFADLYAALLREMKFGNLRPDITSTLPPSGFSSTRYVDSVGSIAGARSFSITIGDGSSSYGDLNASSNNLGTVLQQAHDALDATEGGSILVRAGSYVWNVTLATNRPLKLVFEEGVVLAAGTYSTNSISLQSADVVEVVGMPSAPSAALPFPITTTVNSRPNLILRDCFTAINYFNNTTTAQSTLRAENCVFTAVAGSSAIVTNPVTAENFELLEFKNCTIRYLDTTGEIVNALVQGHLENTTFENCIFDLAADTGSATQFMESTSNDGLVIRGCKFIDTNTGAALNPLNFDDDTATGLLTIEDCTFDFTWGPTTTSLADRTVVFVDHFALDVRNCDFSAIVVADTSAVDFGNLIYIEDTDAPSSITGCRFGNQDGTVLDIPHFIYQININNSSDLLLDGNFFYYFHKGIVTDGGRVNISNNVFDSEEVSSPTTIDVTAIEKTAGTVSVQGNSISLRSGAGTSASIDFIGISLPDSSDDIISGNEISALMEGGSFDAILLTDSNFPQATITGNEITVQSTNNGNAAVNGIRVSSAAVTTHSVLISGNIITITNTTAPTADAIGIALVYATNETFGFGTDGSIVDSNIIRISGSDGLTADSLGISVIGVRLSVSNNNILLNARDSASTNTGYGIYSEGHNITITGNSVRLDTQFFLSGIQYQSAAAGDVSSPGQICIIGNNVYSRGSAACINVSISDGDLHGFNVSNNVLIRNYLDDTDSTDVGIDVSTAAAGIKNIVVNGNSVHEANLPSTTNTRRAIAVDADGGGAGDAEGVCISNNVVTAVNTNVVRSTGSAAIRLQSGIGVVVNGNSVRGWVGTGANRHCIDILSATEVTCNSNTVEYSGAAGVASLSATNCTGLQISANSTVGVAIETTGSTNVEQNGNNNT